MILYKYRAPSEKTDAVFADRTVWLATASQLNDPFECSVQDIAGDWIRKHTKDMKVGQISGFITAAARAMEAGSNFYGLSPKETKHALRSLKITKERTFDRRYRRFRKIFADTTGRPASQPERVFSGLESQLQSVGIFSLAERADNDLMWAHYGDQHKGIAIGFDASTGSALSDPNRCAKVAYSSEVPRFSDGFRARLQYFKNEDGHLQASQDISFNDPVLMAAITTKAPSWAYEQEWRYFEEAGGAYPWPGPLVEVVFGLRCTAATEAHYRTLALAHAGGVTFRRIAKVPNTTLLRLDPA